MATTPRRADARWPRYVESVLAGLLLALVLPLFLVITIAVVLESRGPVFVHCHGQGRRGEQIDLLIFRTAPGKSPGLGAQPTRFGTLLRRTGLDHLPSLWNVVSGDASLLGLSQC